MKDRKARKYKQANIRIKPVLIIPFKFIFYRLPMLIYPLLYSSRTYFNKNELSCFVNFCSDAEQQMHCEHLSMS